VKLQRKLLGLFVVYLLLAHLAFAADDTLEEIVVTASLRSTNVADLPQSVTVLDDEALHAAGVQHFEDVLALIPDLNWAAGTSRPRFFQLRGIGEVEQYQGAPNPSVGFLIDDIDFSGVGMPATLLATLQVEVLRGPQGTTNGANALAGLISVRTADPGRDFELNSKLSGATYDTRSAGVVIGDGFASVFLFAALVIFLTSKATSGVDLDLYFTIRRFRAVNFALKVRRRQCRVPTAGAVTPT
jgi:iron complex outermembrane recepter protein